MRRKAKHRPEKTQDRRPDGDPGPSAELRFDEITQNQRAHDGAGDLHADREVLGELGEGDAGISRAALGLLLPPPAPRKIYHEVTPSSTFRLLPGPGVAGLHRPVEVGRLVRERDKRRLELRRRPVDAAAEQGVKKAREARAV